MNNTLLSGKTKNTTVLYEDGWEDKSIYISKELDATVFSFQIHDSHLWMYLLYDCGKEIDRYSPIPDYWDDGLSEEEKNSWKGSA
jgi:hypothetical protein